WFKPEADCQYIGIHWLVTPSDKHFSRYPPGLPVLVGLVYRTLGYKASVLVNPMLALLSLVGFYLLVRRVLTEGWALGGVAVLAMNPIFNQHALACDSHVAVTFCLIWGLYFLLRWSEHGRVGEVFVAGLFLGAIPTIRYPDGLFGLAIAVFLLWHGRSRPRIWRHYAAVVAGAVIPIVPLLVRNHLAFGAFWQTGYALTNEQTGFAWDYFRKHFVSYVRQIHGDGLGLLFALGVVGMTWMCGVRQWRRLGALLVLLALPTLLLYMAYYWAPQAMANATMRFLLPTFPCYILAGMWALSEATGQAPGGVRFAVPLVVLVLQAIWGGPNSLAETARLHYQKLVLARVTDALERQSQHGDVVVSNPQVLQHLDFVRRWRLADFSLMRDPTMMTRFTGLDQDPDAPRPLQLEKQKRRVEKYGGKSAWDRERMLAKDIHEWAGGRKVYYVGLEKDIQQMWGPYFHPKALKIIARVPLPEPPPMPEPEGMMGAGMRLRSYGPPFGPLGRDFGGRRPDGPPGPPFRPGQFRPRGPGGPPFGLDFLQGEKEMVIAEWTFRVP
ncbi:MAG: glycosyltransferase family 39 protein, partial [Planctomycetes bacterium]|nr:glycosyltransferase family 39 protein [Planctomycetota bacterium]